MAVLRMIDTSHHQGPLSVTFLKQLKAKHGLSILMAKCTEGMTFTDSEFAATRIAAKAAGYAFGAYHYVDANDSGPITQARRFFSIFKPRAGDFWCMDLERSDGLSQVELNAWAMGFGDEMRRLWPGSALAYLGGYSGNGTGRGASLHFDGWMFPRYASMNPSTAWPSAVAPRVDANTTGWLRPHIWQWTPALPPGIDASVSSLTVAELAAPSSTPGGDLVLAASQFDQLMVAIANIPHDVQAYHQEDADGNPTTDQAWGYLQDAATNSAAALAILKTVTPQSIAAAVWAARPPDAGDGGLTLEQIGDEVEKRLRAVLGSLNDAAPTT